MSTAEKAKFVNDVYKGEFHWYKTFLQAKSFEVLLSLEQRRVAKSSQTRQSNCGFLP